jgi:APA family basic amino acid/polyamine antiporter
MILGLDIYLAYSIKHSALSAGSPDTIPQGNKIGGICGLSLSVILAIVAFVHHTFTSQEAAEAIAKGVKLEDVPNDNGIFYFSLAFAAVHAILFGLKMAKKKQ